MTANKEGLGSFLGYLALFLLATKIGGFLFRPRDANAWRRVVLPRLVTCTAILWVVVTFMPIQTSRQMANLPYIAWTLMIAMSHLILYLFTDMYLMRHAQPFYIPSLVRAVNRNQLAFFLLVSPLFLSPLKESSSL